MKKVLYPRGPVLTKARINMEHTTQPIKLVTHNKKAQLCHDSDGHNYCRDQDSNLGCRGHNAKY